MTTFWIITALLVLFSMAMVLLPIVFAGSRREESAVEVSDKDTNIAYFREQADELQTQVKAGVLSAEEADALRQELEKKLLTDVAEHQEINSPSASSSNLASALALGLVVPVLALPLYYKLGATVELNVTDTLMSQETSVEQKLDALEQWHNKRPDNPQAMFLLSGEYLRNDRAEDAVNMLRQLYTLTNGHFQAAEQLAQALYIEGGNEITEEIRRLIATTLAVDETSATALGLKGIDAYRQGNFREAISVWNTAMASEQNPLARAELSARVREAREQLGLPEAEVRVNVSLSPELRELPGETRVIIFARASGGRTPVAAVPLSVSELPKEIVLDDRSAMMMHGGSLGDIQTLDLIGRISMGGDVSQPDYEAMVRAVEVGQPGVVELEISPAS